MEENRIDQFFRTKLDQVDPASYHPEHWEQVKKLIVKKKKRRSWLYWLLLPFLLLTGWIVYSLVGWYQHKTPEVKNSLIPLEMAQSPLMDPKHGESDTISNPHFSVGPAIGSLSQDFHDPQRFDDISSINEQTTTTIKDPHEPALAFENFKERNPVEMEAKQSSEGSNLQGSLKPTKELNSVQFYLDYRYGINPGSGRTTMNVEKIRHNRLGWASTLLINPAGSSSVPVQGLIFGFNYERYLGRHWLVGVRPSFQLRANEGGFSKFEQITTFGFSSTNTTYGLKANSLQFLSVPFYLATEFGRHTIEGGGSLDLLMGARGQLQAISVENQVVSHLESFSSGWISTNEMKKLSPNLFIGYKTTINNHLKTGITFFYSPGKIYPGLPNNQNQIINGKWYLGWQAIYYTK